MITGKRRLIFAGGSVFLLTFLILAGLLAMPVISTQPVVSDFPNGSDSDLPSSSMVSHDVLVGVLANRGEEIAHMEFSIFTWQC